MVLHFVTSDAADAAVGATVTLTGAEAHHAAVVRRVRVGERVSLGDGCGVWLDGTCRQVAPKQVDVEVTGRRVIPAASPRIVLVQALAKGGRDEMAVQAAVELGVDEIVPWRSARSVSRWDGPKAEKGRTRWAAIAREAGKQAHRAWIPEVRSAATTAQLAARAGDGGMLVLEPAASEALSERVSTATVEEIVLVVGPEGGLAPEEREILRAAGAHEVTLGPHVLRTSTAGPAALAALGVLLHRW